MNKILLTAASGLFLVACAAVPSPAVAENPNVMIMGEDADRDTVPCSSRVFKRVLGAMSNQLNQREFVVYDETAVTLDGFVQGRCRRTDAELIDIAKSLSRPPIDVVVVFSIYASTEELSYTQKIHARIEGRLLDVQSGRRLGNFEVKSPSNWAVQKDCPRECILESVGDRAKLLATDLGAVLSIQLAAASSGDMSGSDEIDTGGVPNAYTVVFDNFCDDGILDVEEYLVAFQGYQTHRPTYTSMCHHEYWYESYSDAARFNRNLRKMLDRLNTTGRVTFSGNVFIVEKIAMIGN